MLRIAIRMLLGDGTKWLGVVLGVFLCTFLITHMLSMFSGLMTRSYSMVTDIPQAEVWVMDAAVQYVDEPIGMPPTALNRVQGVPGVAWAVPLHTSTLRARLPSGAFQAVLIVGVDDASLMGAPDRILGEDAWILRRADTCIVDVASTKTLLQLPTVLPEHTPGWHVIDFDSPKRDLRPGDELLINDHRLVVGALAELGSRFLSKPIVYTTYSRAIAIAPKERNLLSFVLVKPLPGVPAADLARSITRETGLRARTSQEFADDTYWFYVRTTGVVARIGFMVGIAVTTGVSVSALLLYLFTNENLRYYAVLKALGATNGIIARMVVTQAIVACSTGYALGVGFSSAMGSFLVIDAMPYKLLWTTMALAGGAVMLVGVVAGTLSMQRLVRLEAGAVFKN